MATQVTYVELYKESRNLSFTPDSVSRKFVLVLCGDFFDSAEDLDFWGKADDNDVSEWIVANIPWYQFVKISGQTVVVVLANLDLTQEANDIWRAEITYEMPDNNNSSFGNIAQDLGLGPDAGETNTNEFTQVSFNSSVETNHVTTSLKLLEIQKASWVPAAITPPAGLVPNAPSPIGLTNNEIKGADTYIEVCTFQVTQYFSPQKLTYKYVRQLRLLVGRLNDKTWFGFPKGSVLFKGHTAQGDLVQNVPVTFEFEVKNNFLLDPIQPDYTPPPEEDDPNLMFNIYNDPTFAATTADALGFGAGIHSGHSYIDYLYVPIPDNNSKSLVMRPAFRLIHQMQRFGDFTKLNL